MTATTDSDLCLVDSSGWIEYLGDGPKADAFEWYLERGLQLLVPAIVVYEVHKKLLVTNNGFALQRFISHAFHSIQVSLDFELAAVSAKASIDHRLAMADAMIYAIAQHYGAQLVTADPDFRGLPGVIFL
ncbi:MAG: type II toxin-antitoxin system VapC family toxin [Candidatus Acidiferrales bacterium]